MIGVGIYDDQQQDAVESRTISLGSRLWHYQSWRSLLLKIGVWWFANERDFVAMSADDDSDDYVIGT